MTTYNSYTEAKIANPECAIFEYLRNFGADKEIIELFDIQSREMKECNPADHCMTVERFLADGYEFVEGDVYLNSNGRTLGVVNIPEYNNKRSTIDCNLYILRAAALEEKPSEMVEWVNGDECRYANDINHEYIYIGKHPHTDGHYVFSERKGIVFAREGCLIKPETKQQREDRERLEAAYDLLCIGNRALNVTAPCTLVEFKLDKPQRDFWLAVVDKTNYRKGVK